VETLKGDHATLVEEHRWARRWDVLAKPPWEVHTHLHTYVVPCKNSTKKCWVRETGWPVRWPHWRGVLLQGVYTNTTSFQHDSVTTLLTQARLESLWGIHWWRNWAVVWAVPGEVQQPAGGCVTGTDSWSGCQWDCKGGCFPGTGVYMCMHGL